MLPPQSLCCGFPLKVNAKKKAAEEIALRNSIILTQIREMLGHIEFAAIIVSCGTCREALHEIASEEIFECSLRDISDFILDDCPWQSENKLPETILYHTPCHDSFKGAGPAKLRRIYNGVIPVANCCSEAGTLALSRPDISNAMRLRKREQIEQALSEIGIDGMKSETTFATNCPSCITGLGRNRELGYKPRHIAEILAEIVAGGDKWKSELKSLAAKGERVLF